MGTAEIAETEKKRTISPLTEGSIVGNIWKLALPMMFGYALQNVFNIVDMIFVGRLGPAAIASVSMSGILMGFIFMIAIGISTGTIAMVSRFVGAGRKEEAGNVVMQSVFLGVISAVIVAVLGYIFASSVLKLLGASDAVVDLGTSYIRVMSIGAFTIFFSFFLNSSLRGAGDAITPAKIMALATVINIGLDPIMIFGLFGFPRMGVAGSALATVIARGIGVVIIFWIFFSKRSVIHLSLKHIKLDLNIIGRIIRIGIFGSVEGLIRNISGLVLMRIIAFFGTNTVAAFGIGMRLQMLAMMLGFGFANAAAILVGQNLGAEKPKRAEKSAWLAVGFYEILLVVMAVIFFTFPRYIIGIFNNHPEVINIGSIYLRFFAVASLFIGLSIVLGRALSGSGDTVSPMFITGISLFVFQIPLAILLLKPYGIIGVWVATVIAGIVQGLVTAFWFNKGKWKYRKV